MKNVLYVSYDGMTDPLGQSQVLPYLFELVKHGYSFTILSFEKKDRLLKEGDIIHSLIKDKAIKWVPLIFTSKPPVLAKIYDRDRMWRTANKLQQQNKFDIIHCRSYVAAEIGLELKNKYGVKFLFDMRGFWADEKVDNGQWNLKNPLFKRIYRHYKQKEKEFLLNADGIVSLTTTAKEFLLDKKEFSHLQIEVIPCCADFDHFDYTRIDQQQVQELKDQLAISPETKVITYLGSIGGWYMTKEMFSFFRKLLLQDSNFHMLILTKDDAAHVKAEAIACGINERKITVTYSPRKALPYFLALSNASIFFIRNTFSKMASSPTKHAELMGMGIPVICNEIGDTGHIIKKTGTGLVIKSFNEEDFEEVIGSIGELIKTDKAFIRHHALNIFDLKTGAESYRRLYSEALLKK